MLEKFNDLARAAATNISRRQMFGRLGHAAAGAAAMLVGLLPSQAEAARGPRYPWYTCCGYACPDGSSFSIRRKGHCRQMINGCQLVGVFDCGGGP